MAHTDSSPRPDPWVDGPERVGGREALVIDIEGFEGPLDLLLELARTQKVDLARLSIANLAEQYLAFIAQARTLRLELAADYLVMAAWLAFLKSRLLIPAAASEDEPPAAELAQRLAFRLQRLQAMREAAAQLMSRNRLDRDVFQRGQPEPLVLSTSARYEDNLVDLLKAYAQRRQKRASVEAYRVVRLPTWTIAKARETLERLVGRMDDWSTLQDWLQPFLAAPGLRNSVLASSFTASLELAREGVIEIRQDEAFRPIYLRRKG